MGVLISYISVKGNLYRIEDLFIKFFDFKNCLWEGVGIKFYYEEFKRKKKCSYVCENVIKIEMVGIKFSSRDNMKLVEWIGLV